jgi:predicted HTH transcriptional regulator
MYFYIELINGKQECIIVYLNKLITQEQYNENQTNISKNTISRNILENKCNQIINEIINENTQYILK